MKVHLKKYHFIGIGGSGMSSLAQVVKSRGNQVTGSDRSHDRALNDDLFRLLRDQGIELFPQDGSGLTADTDVVVVSTAIEKDNPDIKKAQMLGIPVFHRAKLLAEIFNPSFGIAVGGTSGKSTVTGMISVILEKAGLDPTVINGGVINSFQGEQWLGNARLGTSNMMVIETDESDGSIVNFSPQVGVITNISRDHKDVGELLSLFDTFVQAIKGCLVINGDCPLAGKIRPQGKRIITYGFAEGDDIKADNMRMSPDFSQFQVQDTSFQLFLPGRHNVSNALAAISVARYLDIDPHHMQEALEGFRGIKRRLELIGKVNGISLFDDFSHNPAKIASAIETLRMAGKRLIVIFQPHGYGPTKFLLEELAEVFNHALLPSDHLFLTKIYDAGGSAERTVSSLDLLRKVTGPAVQHSPDREGLISEVKKIARAGDAVVVMGARDDTLSLFVRRLARSLQGDEI
jgi:UDP-N-acetylmuramate--alanine ligase